MRLLLRFLAVVIPWLIYFIGISATFGPQSGADWVLVGHWLLIPFLPIYLLVLVVAFRFTRQPIQPSYTRKLREKQGSQG